MRRHENHYSSLSKSKCLKLRRLPLLVSLCVPKHCFISFPSSGRLRQNKLSNQPYPLCRRRNMVPCRKMSIELTKLHPIVCENSISGIYQYVLNIVTTSLRLLILGSSLNHSINCCNKLFIISTINPLRARKTPLTVHSNFNMATVVLKIIRARFCIGRQ